MSDVLTRAFKGRRVLVTGDTGFKGSWLALWLHELGAKVHGYALPPEHPKDHFRLLKLDRLIRHRDGDIRRFDDLLAAFKAAKPEFVFHLAAQPLVRRSYGEPRETFETNVQGSVNVLECARRAPSVASLVYVTSDKCYENREDGKPCREHDRLGGRDPYSASKAAAELVLPAYRASYFDARGLGAASARAGNVIGGGDRAPDRIIPDLVRSLEAGKPLPLRYPQATRPWQHVLDPLRGYLILAARLAENPKRYSGAWNFGPNGRSRSVIDLVNAFLDEYGRAVPIKAHKTRLHEAGKLALDSSLARRRLGWRPAWDFARAAAETAAWHRHVAAGADARELSRAQIERHQRDAAVRGGVS